MEFKINSQEEIKVSIIDIKMPFLSMVILLVKLSIAAIPAFIIMSIVGSFLFAIFGTAMHAGMGF